MPTQSVAPSIPDTDGLCLNETVDEDGLEHENKKRKLPTPAEAVSESRADESDFDRFDDLPPPEGKTLFVNIASKDEAEDDLEQDQEVTRSLVQGGGVDGPQCTNSKSSSESEESDRCRLTHERVSIRPNRALNISARKKCPEAIADRSNSVPNSELAI